MSRIPSSGALKVKTKVGWKSKGTIQNTQYFRIMNISYKQCPNYWADYTLGEVITMILILLNVNHVKYILIVNKSKVLSVFIVVRSLPYLSLIFLSYVYLIVVLTRCRIVRRVLLLFRSIHTNLIVYCWYNWTINSSSLYLRYTKHGVAWVGMLPRQGTGDSVPQKLSTFWGVWGVVKQITFIW